MDRQTIKKRKLWVFLAPLSTPIILVVVTADAHSYRNDVRHQIISIRAPEKLGRIDSLILLLQYLLHAFILHPYNICLKARFSLFQQNDAVKLSPRRASDVYEVLFLPQCLPTSQAVLSFLSFSYRSHLHQLELMLRFISLIACFKYFKIFLLATSKFLFFKIH